ncbi:glycosyltransferase family 39 protein [Metallibacterium sp.]|uniref:glycosyltransferase family 39 protein n=1 Tax=Metallibacterium sp. TaxID=2940281 RepID=UPI002622B250|nr:glycosyltransferase family 39 protein [Metallibacterium sp.]
MNLSYRRLETLRALWPWAPLWLALALLAIFAHGPMPMHSTRTLGVAWDMWQHASYIVPMLNGAPYSDKAPLLYWLFFAGWSIGGVSDLWPRLLLVLIGLTQLILVQALARRLFPTRPWIARSAPWLLGALTYGFLFNLQIMYDGLLAVWVLLALLALLPSPRREAPRFVLFALALGLGLLTKGPVMLLHVALVWLLGPWWQPWARQHRGAWYGRGALALLVGVLMLLAWALPAAWLGGPAYRELLLFQQTAGRVVDAFAHARPIWWYVPLLPLLLFPFALWPRAWSALGSLGRPFEPGQKFLIAWLAPVLVAFSLVSGKQAYYPLPELGGLILLLAFALARQRERHPAREHNAWLGPWPLAVFSLLLGMLLFALPWLGARGDLVHDYALRAVAVHSPSFGVVFVLLAGWLLLRGRGELRRIAVAGLLGVVAANALFTLTLWRDYDLRRLSTLLAQAQTHGVAIGNIGMYEGQYHFLGRLQKPIAALEDGAALNAWLHAHPTGWVLAYPSTLDADARRYALYAQRFRGVWVVLWPARTLAALRAGHEPPAGSRPALVVPGAGDAAPH